MIRESKKRYIVLLFVLFLLFSGVANAPKKKVLRIYLDADQTGTSASGLAIRQGIELALSEINYEIQGYQLELIIKDHHGSTRRSFLHMQEFINDESALLMYSGLHSPPLLGNLEFINENGILFLDPWAAAGPITRTMDEDGRNWVFRLSIDDTVAGEVITAFACDKEQFKRPVLLLEDTGWGQSNLSTLAVSLAARGLEAIDVIWFDWNVGIIGAKEILTDISGMNADVIFLVANASEGITFINAMAERNQDEIIPIRSHWGITGGNFIEIIGTEILAGKIDLKFIQTCYSFTNKEQTPFALDVFKRACKLFPNISSVEDLKSPAGFIHSYDLTKILIAALGQIELGDNMRDNRIALQWSLENLKSPVPGLIKIYRHPFGQYSVEKPNAHEALGAEEFRMAEYTESGTIKVLGK